MTRNAFFSGILAGTLTLATAVPASAAVIFSINVNGTGSYSIDGGPTVVDNGVLLPDPSSTIGVNVLTFAFPVGQGDFPGDIRVMDFTGTNVIGLFRFTDAAGDINGQHLVDRIILYSTANAGNPADTGLPPNAQSFSINANVTGLAHYFAEPNSYTVQFEAIPEPASLALLGTAALGLGMVRRNRRSGDR